MTSRFRILCNPARRLLAIALVVSIGPAAPLLAQVSAVASSQTAAPQALHIVILDGEDALNNIRERTAREPIVQVEDENHKPVAGALILFSIQNGSDGAGASFNGVSSLSVTTDAEGKATAHGLLPNQVQGKYSIAVQATLGTLVATAIIAQSNVVGGAGGGSTPVSTPPAEPGTASPPATSTSSPVDTSTTTTTGGHTRRPYKITHFIKKPWVIAGTVIVVGVVVGVVVATRGSSSTTITPGTGTVGP